MYYWDATTQVRTFQLVRWRGKVCAIWEIDHKAGEAVLLPYKTQSLFSTKTPGFDTYKATVPIKELRRIPWAYYLS